MKGHSSIKRAERGTPARHRLHVGLFMALAALAAGNAAHAQQRNVVLTPQDYSITAGSLGDALNQLATQSKLQIVYSPELVGGKTAPAISGQQTWREALQKLLAGSGLEWGFVNDTTVVIRQSGKTKPAPQKAVGPAHKPTTKSAQKPEPTTLQSVTVTGTRIRGGTTPSPVIAIGSEQMREEGFSDLGEVIRDIPQNFNGGQNPGVMTATGSGNVYNQNATGGSSLNLRGIGADATLTLLNGRRLPDSGFGQAVDISAIPVEAVERIDIVADGASAIYGSDAVAGVGNVVLKRDFDGLTVGTRYGGSTDGGLTTRDYTAVAGTAWASGGLIATYKNTTVDPIRADQRGYTAYMDEPFVLYPGSELHSGLLSIHQALSDRVEFQLDAFRTKRKQTWFQNYGAFYYENFFDTTTTSVAPSVEFDLPGDWVGSVGAAWGRDRNINRTQMVTAGTDAPTLEVHSCYCNDSESLEAGAEGPLFTLPGGDARLAVGAGSLKSRYEDVSYLSGSREGGRQGSRHVYGELNLPLVGPDMDVAGARRLVISAALRRENYDSFGSVTTPKLGLIYGPGADFTLKASWGKSFKAPMLSQLYANRIAGLWTASAVGGAGYPSDATVLMAFGGNPELKPERANTLTTSLAFHPAALPALDAELTWFRINYDQRVVRPLPVYSQSLSNPALADFIQYSPSAEDLAAVLATYSQAFYNYAGADYDPRKVVAIAYGQYANATRQRIDGVDLTGTYRMDLGTGRLTLRGSASWLDSSQRNTANQPPFDLAGTIFYPAKVNARLGAVWANGGVTASAFANYVDGVTDRTSGKRTSSFTTFDATIRYAFGGRDSPWSGLELSLIGQNLLNRAPPLYAPVAMTDVPYDSTNYSAIGRFLSIALSKHW
ncbi:MULTISPECIES: TonB-dependent receptor [Rhodanobacter]|uniref:TonB-dependent receptor n=1 Tax=Rhodanobacter TaxID=75309 RepID=UPI000AB7055D|nr:MULTISPECIES: TonB-dependent receptor [Rhodanobacter]UJJ50976.1 TonB-dependent receptor [Rhodanobacter denitrificans]UJM93689.1 TonB-dependent receptor [Rhodanobacter denitrificans]UJM97220.1 TonB-dependent receptor [Rhodanobacter denitrificans]UJN19952.1 TonB-dependent receptor [Rhodanobacter denitrificans]